MFRRRETMIALRARHQSFRVATDIGQPHMDVPPPPQPAIPIVPAPRYLPRPPPTYVRYQDPPPPRSKLVRALMSDIVLSLLAILSGIGVVLLCKYG